MTSIWKYFAKINGSNFRARCMLCRKSLSYKTTSGNLTTHIKRKHLSAYSELRREERDYNRILEEGEDQDENSNSSVKFSSEIWGHFEVEGSSARCSVCQVTTDNSVEEMKQHLEEDHPGIMINILSNKKANPIADDLTDDERVEEETIDEDAFTEVVYLEEETKRKRKPPLALTKRRRTIEKQERPRLEYKEHKNIPQAEPVRPEIDSFLNYIGVLLRNVPKEAFPKLQLDVISLVLNAQMANTSSLVDVTGVPVSAINNTGEYHITIENKEPPSG